MADYSHTPRTTPRKSWTFDDYTLSEIRRAAATGIYDIRGGGSKRRLPHFDDLVLLGASMSALSAGGLPREMRAPTWCWAPASPRSRSS